MRIGALRTRSRRPYGLAAAVLALGLAGGAAATTSLALAAADARDAALGLRTATVRTALDTTFSRYSDALHDLAASPPADSAALARLVGDRLDGAHQALVVAADGTVLAQYTADGTTPLVAERLSPEPELARAMELAREHGRLVASPAHELPADADLPPAHRQRSFEIAAPVHRDGKFDGWVIVSARANDLLDASMAAGGVTGVTTTLTETSPGGVSQRIATWRQGTGVTGPERWLDVPLAGHFWQVQVQAATPLISAGRQAAAPLMAIGAVVLSLGMAALLFMGGDRKGLERQVREAEERADAAEQARRVREDELAGFASTANEHLHSPLHTIAGYTEVLLEDAGPQLDEESRGFLLRIDAATRRMLSLVDELATYTDTDGHALKVEPIELSMLALDVAADHLTASFQADDLPAIEVGELPAVSADAVLIRQVLAQFVGNAVRYVREGAPARITISAVEQPGGWWRVEVADRGIGVPEDERTRIFAPFHRAPAAEGYPGKGLGLAVASRIVALHGGEIGLRPNQGGGSVFWFTVPAVPATKPALV